MFYIAHAGEEHLSDATSFEHVIKHDGWKILLVTAIFTLLSYFVLRIISRSTKSDKTDKNTTKEEE